MHWLKSLGARSRQTVPGALIAVLVLCLFVFLQMLGVPQTLWDPSANLDTPSASVLEGFSIPPAVPRLELPSVRMPHAVLSESAHVPVLFSSLFRPPVR